jgi:Icc-related predicted phosphoesterase
MMMQIMTVSDRIMDRLYSSQVGQQYSDIDLLIGCGDLPYYYLEFLLSSLNTSLVFVRGNHDKGPQYTADGRVLTRLQGGIDLHGRVINQNGLLIAGLEGSMRYKPNAPLMYSEGGMTLQVAALVPKLLRYTGRYRRKLDILVTHSPPFGIHDEPDLAHRGFKAFLPLISFFKPRYHFHGHVHVYRNDAIRETNYKQTKIINVFPLRLIAVDA